MIRPVLILIGLALLASCHPVLGPFQKDPEVPTAPSPWGNGDPGMHGEAGAAAE